MKWAWRLEICLGNRTWSLNSMTFNSSMQCNFRIERMVQNVNACSVDLYGCLNVWLFKIIWWLTRWSCWIYVIHTLHVYYAHAAANLNSGYSKYAKVARMHYFCTIALRTSRAVLTRAWASRRVDLRERRVDSFSKQVIIFCW